MDPALRSANTLLAKTQQDDDDDVHMHPSIHPPKERFYNNNMIVAFFLHLDADRAITTATTTTPIIRW